MPEALPLIQIALLAFVLVALWQISRRLAAPAAELRAGLESARSEIQALRLDLGRLEGALSALGRMQESQGQHLAQATAAQLETVRTAVEARLAQAVNEAAAGRQELRAGQSAFENKVEQRLASFDAGLSARSEALQTVLQQRLEESARAVAALIDRLQEDAAASRQEMNTLLTAFRHETTQAVGQLAAENQKTRAALGESATAFEQRIQERFEALSASNQQTLGALKADLATQLSTLGGNTREQLSGHGEQLAQKLLLIQEAVTQRLSGLIEQNAQSAEQLRGALNERLSAIQLDNTEKLEAMRRTVDEKLHATLEERLGQSFKLVSERLEQVHAGLGEMRHLATGVGDLKRVLTNVKTRGTWGEVQLEAMLEQVLTPEQYACNVATRPGSGERVEIAIRLPGRSGVAGETPVWLPIDAKFPVEDYQRLLDAQDRADAEQVEAAAKALEGRIRAEAKTIHEKYVEPPHTTDFAVLYLPTEGLYAEVLRRPGLTEAIQRDYRIVVSGPTTLAAMLNSLQMGFRTLVIEKRSSEVWSLLGAVKSEFGKFGEVIAATQKKLEAATNQFSQVGTRTRAIERKLREVQALPAADGGAPAAAALFDDDETAATAT